MIFFIFTFREASLHNATIERFVTFGGGGGHFPLFWIYLMHMTFWEWALLTSSSDELSLY
jgi:hypothetical protein